MCGVDRMHQTGVKILDETIGIELRKRLNRREKRFSAAELRERERSRGYEICE